MQSYMYMFLKERTEPTFWAQGAGRLADQLSNIGRQEGDMVLCLVLEVINTVAPEGRITMIDIDRYES